MPTIEPRGVFEKRSLTPFGLAQVEPTSSEDVTQGVVRVTVSGKRQEDVASAVALLEQRARNVTAARAAHRERQLQYRRAGRPPPPPTAPCPPTQLRKYQTGIPELPFDITREFSTPF